MDNQIKLPTFTGFYESWWDMFIENYIDCQDGEICEDLFYDHFDNNKYMKVISSDYVDYFITKVKEECRVDISSKVKFLNIDSPREYNFSTDEIIINVDIDFLENVKTLSAKIDDFNDILISLVNERCSHRSGFISFYDNDLSAWYDQEKSWDHNQNSILFEAFLMFMIDRNGGDDLDEWEYDIFEYWSDYGINEVSQCLSEEYFEKTI